VLRDDSEIQKLREARGQLAQKQMMLQAAEQVSGTVQKGSDAQKKQAEAQKNMAEAKK
jgi:hypothetical protein